MVGGFEEGSSPLLVGVGGALAGATFSVGIDVDAHLGTTPNTLSH
jgi:hypothetical protein